MSEDIKEHKQYKLVTGPVILDPDNRVLNCPEEIVQLLNSYENTIRAKNLKIEKIRAERLRRNQEALNFISGGSLKIGHVEE